MFEYFFFMRGIGEFAAKVLAWEMQKFMHARAPFGAVSDIVHDSVVRDPHARVAFAGVTA